MTPLAIWALIKRGASKAWALVTAYPWQAAALASLALSAWLWHGKADLADQLTQAEATLAAVKPAQEKAAVAQAAVNHIPAAKSQQIAENSNAHAPEYYADVQKAGIAYAAAHPVRLRAAADQGQPGNSSMPGTDSAAQVDDHGGDATDMVSVSRADFDLLTANSGRLAQVHQDAQALIAAGVAVASE